MTMASIFQFTKNTRAILPGSLRFIRSDVPAQLTPNELLWLKEHNVRTVIDLREEDERNPKPCPLMGITGFRYLCMPVTGGNQVPHSPADVSRSYISMVDSWMSKIIDAAWTAESNVLYFCNAGKDRTGVVSALLLQKLGMDRDYIIRDYLKSAENLREMLAAYAEQHSEIDINVITPKAEYMEVFLDHIEGIYGEAT